MTGDVLITDAEIKTLRAGAVTITMEDALKALHVIGKRKFVKPLVLASGFKVSMSVNDLGTGRRAEHVSVYNRAGRTDPADAERIASAVLGEGYMVWGDGELLEENKHFIKLIQKKQQEE